MTDTTDTKPADAPAPAAPVDPELTALIAKIDAVVDAVAKLTAPPGSAPVPTTDTTKPTVTPKTTDPLSLPPIARIAAGYSAMVRK